MSTLKNIAAVAILAALAVATPAFAAVTHSGKAVAKTTVVTEGTASSTTSTAYVNLPLANAAITVPAGKFQLVTVRFSAESYCFGSAGAGNWCSVRILADGVEMLPAVGFNYAFDSRGASDDYWEGHAMERALVLGAGAHTISVQYGVTDANLSFGLDDWTLTVTQQNNGI
jgi:hypothetical protein